METIAKYKVDYEDKIKYGGRILYRIVALRDFSDVKAGDRGGYVQSERNLSQQGDCWIYDEAMAMDNTLVAQNAKMYHSAKLWGSAKMTNFAEIHNKAQMFNKSFMGGHARIFGESMMYDCSKILDLAEMHGCSCIMNNASMYDDSSMYDYSIMCGTAEMHGGSEMHDKSSMFDNARIHGNTKLYGIVHLSGNTEIRGDAVIRSIYDYIVFKNWWSSGRYFVWTRSNNMYTVGCFYGTGEELIMKAYQDSELSGQEYERIVRYVEGILNLKRAEKKKKISFIKRLLKYLTKK